MKWILIVVLLFVAGCKGTSCQLVTGTNDVWASNPTQKIEIKLNFALDK
jgi:hypothetical protein